MNSTDLYAILGVKRNATAANIRNAFIRKCKVLHPDAGGTTEQFQEVQRAYQVLKDKTLRKKYDETGNVDIKNLDHERNQVLGMLGTIVNGFLQDLEQAEQQHKREFDFDHQDIVAMMVKHGHAILANMMENAVKAEKAQRKMDAILKRAKLKGPDQAFLDIIRFNKGRIDKALKDIQENIRHLKEALTILESHEYQVDAQTMSMSGFGGSSFINLSRMS